MFDVVTDTISPLECPSAYSSRLPRTPLPGFEGRSDQLEWSNDELSDESGILPAGGLYNATAGDAPLDLMMGPKKGSIPWIASIAMMPLSVEARVGVARRY